ncbi:right-handed parallel beta-helix repeat-containing protein [Caldilinea sp.]|uniref:right-handed parallel beta-helix repeat-containing protein n=1 Tax=Caldilinea sp. TaxID=2293560 RepID=UPI002C175B94|nr:right-handed parallel beta-helix repeat-containing protein [Caldilinea sp.]
MTVRPAVRNGWSFILEAPQGAGAFVFGPDQPPQGTGSVQMTTSARGAYAIGSTTYAGVRLARISHLSYATYRSSFDPDDHTTLNLQFDIDYDADDGDDTPQGRLVYEPYKSNQPIGGVNQNVWQTWDALAANSAWWSTEQPGIAACPERDPCTWTEVMEAFPAAAISAQGGQLWLRAGNAWGREVTANADALLVGIDSATTLYDFEPEQPCTERCFVDGLLGDDAFGGDSPASAKRTIQAALTQVAPGGAVIVAAGVYSEALTVTKPVTLAGPNQGVCANDDKRQREAVLAPDGRIAFTLAAGVDDVTIDGFTFASPATGGVTTTGAADNFARIVIRNNRFDALNGAAIAGEAAMRAEWEIVCNRIEDADASAIVLLGGENRTVDIAENFLSGNAEAADLSAIVLENSIDATVRENTVTGFGADGIRLVQRALRGAVTDNDITNVGSGVHLLATAGEETNWLEQVYIEYNTIVDVTRAAVLVDHVAGDAAGVIAELCICANTIEQEASLLEDDASLIDLRLRETAEDPYGRIVVRETSMRLRGLVTRGAVHGLRVRGALHNLAIYDNQFDGGLVGGAGAANQPPTSGLYLQTGDASYGVLPISASVTLSGNLITGFENGVTVFDPQRGVYGGLPAGATITASYNEITGNRQYGAQNGAGAVFAAIDNWWGDASGPSAAGPGAGDRVSENVAYCTWLDAKSPGGVATGFVHNLDTNREFCTINSAVAHETTLDGHTLVADARVYPEQVLVTKSITLTGAGVGASIIQAPAAMSPAVGASIVTVMGAGVVANLSGFTIEGPGDAVCGTLRAGVAVQSGAQASIHDNEIRAIRNEPLLACAQGVGIAVGNHSPASVGIAEIANNRIAGNQKAGIVVSGAGSHATIEDNQIEGAGPTGVLVQNGVQVSYGATAAIERNVITGYAYTPFSLVSTAILLYQADADTAGNTLRDNQVGIYLVDSSGVHEGNTISATAAALNSPGFWGIIVDAPPPGRKPQLAMTASQPRRAAVRGSVLTLQATGGERAIQRVIVRNNALYSDGAGVGLQADGGYGALDIDLTATNNEIRGWNRAINLTQCAGNCSGAGYTAVTVRHNLIEQSGIGFDNGSAGGYAMVAAENWWGAPGGPATFRNPGGNGSSLVGDASFAPWLCTGVDADPAIGFQPDAATLCGLAERLIILTQPQGGLEGVPLPQQPAVRVEDRFGNLAINFNGPVTIGPAAGSNSRLGGGVTVNAVTGLVQFSDVRVDTFGAGLVLQFSTPGVPPVASAVIDVTPQTGDITLRVTVIGQPPSADWRLTGPVGDLTTAATGGEIVLDALHANETYTFTLGAKRGYALQTSCDDGASNGNSSNGDSVSIPLAYQADVTCTFVATAQPASLTVRQTVTGQTPVIDWEFEGDLEAFTLPAAGGQQQFSLPAGVYLVQSKHRISYAPSVACTNSAGGGSQVLLVLAPGDAVSCTFTAVERTTGLMLYKTVGLAPDRCGISDIIGVPAGTSVYYCYTILNTGETPLSLHSLADSEAGPVLADLDYVVQPGAKVDTVMLGRVLSETVAATTVSSGVWTASNREGPEARDEATASVNVLRAAIDGVLTVSEEGIGCGSQNIIKVVKGSKVNYCVTLLNSGEAPLSTHQIIIPALGIVEKVDYLLAPGAFVKLTATEIPALGGVTIDDEQLQTLIVHSTNPPADPLVEPIDPLKYLVAPDLFKAESHAQATVLVRSDVVEPAPPSSIMLYLPSVAR